MNAEGKGRDDKTAGKASPGRIKTRNDWRGAESPREWICEGWLSYRLTLFTGHGGAGKSQLALQLAAAIASKKGTNWIPPSSNASTSTKFPTIEPQGNSVLIASWEDEADEVHRRLCSMAKVLGWVAPDQIEDRLHFADLAGSGPLWDTDRKITTVGAGLRGTAEDIEARLLIIDPRAAAYAGDENHRAQVRAFISDWDRWARESHCAVLLVDHLPNSSIRSGVSGASFAGSTDWHNAARCVWTLDEKHVLRCEKSNYGTLPDPVNLIRENGAAWTGTPTRGFHSERGPERDGPNPFGAD